MTYTHQHGTKNGTFLCADVGGTNFRLAAVSLKDGRFTILRKETHSTPEMRDTVSFFHQVRQSWEKDLKARFDGMGLALAGPVLGQKCRMTNADLEVDGAEIQKALGIPVFLMNDLAAVTYGVAAIDHEASPDLIHLGGPKAKVAPGETIRKSVVAPGTGLGVGALVVKKGTTMVLDTESGHIDIAPQGALSVPFQSFMQKRFGETPNVETFISGLGFEHLFRFWEEQNPDMKGPAIDELRAATGNYGAIISKNAATDPYCKAMMQFFINMLARFSSTIALAHLPRTGLYLAGGIPGKNIPWFTQDTRFMDSFTHNHMASISDLLKQIPVYLVNDDDIGLYGAANACILETLE